ncbi:uncharacterized protein [Triticum aestivum]|uniref:uncharacterized protein isoform X2 n=1 Tax=Triticum aestivum TaxID=4565 RepID=UPI001D0034A6|nr:uncharacterized protein LOC123168791 isoform X2 [Triticum aestivum]
MRCRTRGLDPILEFSSSTRLICSSGLDDTLYPVKNIMSGFRLMESERCEMAAADVCTLGSRMRPIPQQENMVAFSK